jgi:hypothetical protein
MRLAIEAVGNELKLDFTKGALVHSNVYEDNSGALSLATAPKMTPQTKHIAVKYHHFLSHVGIEKGIEVIKVNTNEQLADTFTKGLLTDKFCYLYKLLIGW